MPSAHGMTSTGCFSSSTGKTLKVRRSLLSVHLWEMDPLPAPLLVGRAGCLSVWALLGSGSLAISINISNARSLDSRNSLGEVVLQKYLHVRATVYEVAHCCIVLFTVANDWKQSSTHHQRLVKEIMVHPQWKTMVKRKKIKWRDSMLNSLRLVSKIKKSQA